ncbi:MAG: tetratricopeptide repeat protein [Gemmatimonadota bacterium]
MTGLKRLIREAHRRSLWQVMGIYAFTSWVIYQVVLALFEGIGLPPWVPGTALALLLVGLPIVLATAFVQEGGPGLRSEDRLDSVEGLESAADAVAAERPRTVDAGTAQRPDSEPRGAALFTWRKAVTGGVLAFACLGLAASGFMGMRSMGIGPMGTLIAKGELSANARMLIADFGAPAADSSTALAVTEALRIDLPQSPVIRVVDQGEVGPALQRMGLEPTAALSEAVARELAVREGIETVLIGELSPLGTTTQLTARLIAAADGAVLLSVREVAGGPDEIVDAVDRLSARIRERAGETWKSIRASEPLLQATTRSLEALQLYSRAQRAAVLEGDNDRAAELLEEALALDSTFAMGWRKYGVVLTNAGRPRADRVEAFTQALRYSDRLPPLERYTTVASYYTYVEYDPQRAIDAYNEVVERGIAYWGTYNNLALLYYSVGRFENAAAAIDEAVTLNPTALAFGNQVVRRVSAGDRAGAEQALARRMDLYPEHPDNPSLAVRLAYYRGQRDSVRIIAERGLVEATRATDELGPLFTLYEMDELEGRLADARRREERANRIRRQAGDLAAIHSSRLGRVSWTIMMKGDHDAARRLLDEALAEIPLDSIPPLDRPYLWIAEVEAILGNPERARQLLAEREREIPPELRQGRRARTSTEGMIALTEGREEEALELLREATRGTSGLPPTYGDLAWAYDVTGRADSAIAAYHRYEDLQHWSRMVNDDLWLPRVYERLARLHEERGDREEAVLYYARLVDLWADADAELQPRVEAARRALAQLSGEGR